MLLISNAHAFESVELLLHWFSKTLSLLILRKTRNKLEKAQLSHSTTGTGAGAGVTWAAGGTWRHLLVLPFAAGCFILLWDVFYMGCILAFSLDNAGCRSALPPVPGATPRGHQQLCQCPFSMEGDGRTTPRDMFETRGEAKLWWWCPNPADQSTK